MLRMVRTRSKVVDVRSPDTSRRPTRANLLRSATVFRSRINSWVFSRAHRKCRRKDHWNQYLRRKSKVSNSNLWSKWHKACLKVSHSLTRNNWLGNTLWALRSPMRAVRLVQGLGWWIVAKRPRLRSVNLSLEGQRLPKNNSLYKL